ncbi:MAG TPA: integrase arm-type DNA-binding domain-containing protein [Acidobacteriaceae bacterium]|nr:integrase arm-type DNA-binding domain-containing protein [Acidobacteriaceae bacterium]
MPTKPLTDVKLKTSACPKGQAIMKLHDGNGLYLWVFSNGKKHWRFRWHVDGKERLLALGQYPHVSLAEARKRRDKLQTQRANDLDPSAERKAANQRKRVAQANSFQVVALEWYEKQRHTWVASHIRDVDRRLRGNIFPILGLRPIGEIEAPELLSAIRKIESRGSYDLAHRVLQVCGQVFRYGIATGRCTRDLSKDLRGALTPHVKQHQAAVRPEELPKLMRAIAGYDRLGSSQVRLALQLLALTFVRTGELIGATWPEFNLDEKVWVIPAERMKMRAEHIVPLSTRTIALLAELKPLSGHSQFILPGRNAAKTLSNGAMLMALKRLGYKGRMTGHGFRAVASTVLNEHGFRPDVIERQLAHCERNAVRGAYNRAEYLSERKRMMQWWADYVDSVVIDSKVIVGNFGGVA